MTTSRRIFIAHASEDKPAVRQLYRDLEERGFEPWLDEEDLLPGQIWTVEIPKAIRGAAVFLACLSSRSVAKVGYVQNEFRLALTAFAERPPGSIYLIPVRLDDCEVPDLQFPDQGLNLRDVHRVDLFAERGLDRLMRALTVSAAIVPEVSASPAGLQPLQVFRDIDEPWCPEMVVIPAGRFRMGSPPDEADRDADEGPQHDVTIADPFALGRYPVTFAEYDTFAAMTARKLPSDTGLGRGRRPVINVAWHDAQAYAAWLSERTGEAYRLPSEAEWEYACRAGTTTRYSFGDAITPEDANFGQNVGKTTEVDRYRANAFGLHDMHGNVWEWCVDVWHETYDGAPPDGSGRQERGEQSRRILRGGSWYLGPRNLRSAVRNRSSSDNRVNGIGFRVARTLR